MREVLPKSVKDDTSLMQCYYAMVINEDYTITSTNGELFLVNIINGDVYRINDVVQDIFTNCSKEESVSTLVEKIYSMYESEGGTYSKADLESFIQKLIDKGIILI